MREYPHTPGCWKFDNEPLLTLEAYTARYFPQYVEAYRPDYRLRLRSDGRPTRVTPGSIAAQVTKRANRLSEAYSDYLKLYAACQRRA